MQNIIKEALQSKLEQLQLDEKSKSQQVKDFETSVIGEWKIRYIDSIPFISDKAKSDLIITRDSSGFIFNCDADRWGSGITVRRNTNWRDEEVHPELNWFSSSTDKADKYKYLSILQVLGVLANYMETDLNPWNDLMNAYDVCSKKAKEIMGDIGMQIWKTQDLIRQEENKEKESAINAMLAKGKIECPTDMDWIPNFYATANDYRRFTHMTWKENKGGKTYEVSGYILRLNDDGTENKVFNFYNDRVKKDRLLDGIKDALRKVEDYNQEKAKAANETVSA